MSRSELESDSNLHLAFETKILDAFKERDLKHQHWADGLLHVVPHDHLQKLSYHHQHSQYHLVLYWLENFFPQAASWLGVRDLARLALDFIENTNLTNSDLEESANRFVESLTSKRMHQNVAQLECLMRCGLATWKLGAVGWRRDLSELPREKDFAFITLLEHKQAAFVEATGDWSATELWKSVAEGKNLQLSGKKDVIVFFRKDDCSIDYEQWSQEELSRKIENYRV
jgi:hypothetical protein